jgi:hypothetical protein
MVLTRHQRNNQNILKYNDILEYDTDYESLHSEESICLVCHKKFKKNNRLRCELCVREFIRDITKIYYIFNFILLSITILILYILYIN